MLTRLSLFTNSKISYQGTIISYQRLLAAAQIGDSAEIDKILFAKCHIDMFKKLDLNGDGQENVLELLLRKRDFVNARKLLKAGADTGVNIKIWDRNDHGDPYANDYHIHRRCFFDVFKYDKKIREFLEKEAPKKYEEYKY